MHTRRTVILTSAAILTGCGRNDTSAPVQQPQEPPPQPQQDQSQGPSIASIAFDIYAFFVTNPLVRLISALKIISDISEVAQNASRDTSTGLVSFPTKNPGVYGGIQSNTSEQVVYFSIPTEPRQTVQFAPEHFTREHYIDVNNEADVSKIDEKFISDYSDCTVASLNSDSTDFNSNLANRIQCMKSKGYSDNSRVYLQVKLQKYTNV